MYFDKVLDNMAVICKYDRTKICVVPYEKSCHVGGYCSHDPNRFKDKDITSGQVKFLTNKGYKEEDIINLSILEAGDLIKKVKREAPAGTYKIWK